MFTVVSSFYISNEKRDEKNTLAYLLVRTLMLHVSVSVSWQQKYVCIWTVDAMTRQFELPTKEEIFIV
jgi:hypothetical protein